MTTVENKKLVLEHYESFVHKQDAEAIRKQLAADFRDHEMPPETSPAPRPLFSTVPCYMRHFPTCG